MHPYHLKEGSLPLLLCFPHAGTYLPPYAQKFLTEGALKCEDTDWHIDQLYEDILPDATYLKANYHRYYIDLNRPQDDQSLYPGQNTTGLFPQSDFHGQPLYKDGVTLSAEEREERLNEVYRPYHDQIQTQIKRLTQKHGGVILFDCHSIASSLPFLFSGILPNFNIGTNCGRSCSRKLETAFLQTCQKASDHLHFTTVLNGRFKGGWTTRFYAAPEQNIHTLQLELSQQSYMTEGEPWSYDPQKAKKLRPHLKEMLEILLTTFEKLPKVFHD